MKPAIFEAHTTAGRAAYLVDEDTAALAPFNGVTSKHFLAAIEMPIAAPDPKKAYSEEAGKLRFFKHDETECRTIFGPRCCVLAVAILTPGSKEKRNTLEAYGFDPKAAEVLLSLAAVSNRSHVDHAVGGRIVFTGPVEKGVPQPWDDSKFLAAWRWSYWKREKLTGAAQHADMVALGYPYSAAALRKMLSKMGLAKPQSSPKKSRSDSL